MVEEDDEAVAEESVEEEPNPNIVSMSFLLGYRVGDE